MTITNFTQRTIFLTGASGYVGRAILRALRNHRFNVYGLVRSDQAANLVAELGGVAVRGDLARPTSFVETAASCDAVIHAGFSYTAEGKEMSEVDIGATEALVSACEAGRCRHIVYTSSIFSYHAGDGGFDESHSVPRSDNEWRCDLERRFLEGGVTTARTAIRLGWVYGGDGGTLVDWIQSIVKSPDVTKIADYRTTLVHVEDLADLYCLAVEQRIAGVLHGAVQQCRVGELVESVGCVAGAGEGPPATVPPGSVLRRDIAATAPRSRSFGWTPRELPLERVVRASLGTNGAMART